MITAKFTSAALAKINYRLERAGLKARIYEGNCYQTRYQVYNLGEDGRQGMVAGHTIEEASATADRLIAERPSVS